MSATDKDHKQQDIATTKLKSSGGPKMNMREWLQKRRERHSVETARESYSEAATQATAFTLLELCTGGGLDTLAAGITGSFRHLGGTEDVSGEGPGLSRAKARLFQDLTGAKCLGNNRDWKSWTENVTEAVDYLKSGTPCTDYASLGSRQGRLGQKGGDLFCEQVYIIKKLKPKVIRLEMVKTAIEVNDGYELEWVMDNLSHDYKIYSKLIKVWRYGDPSARERIFIMGLRRDCFEGVEWEWPKEILDECSAPTAQDIAVEDQEVKKEYWQSRNVKLEWRADKETSKVASEPGRIQHIGYAGNPKRPRTAGHSSKPNGVKGFEGIFPTQQGTGGGHVFPSRDWEPGQTIKRVRLATPEEWLRCASLNECEYLELARRHYRKNLGISFDQWLRELVNLGVPICTSFAIDSHVAKTLEQIQPQGHKEGHYIAHFEPYSLEDEDSLLDTEGLDGVGGGTTEPFPRSMTATALKSWKGHERGAGPITAAIEAVADSGATDTLHSTAINDWLRDPRPSVVSYETAGPDPIRGDLEGELEVAFLNVNQDPKMPRITTKTITTTTIKGLEAPLLSLEAMYRQGYDITMRHGYSREDFTGMHLPQGTQHGGESMIPMVDETAQRGGWKVYYCIRRPGLSDEEFRSEAEGTLARIVNERKGPNAPRRKREHTYSAAEARTLTTQYWGQAAVSQTIEIRVPGERNIRPALRYGGLKRYRHKNVHEFHSAMAHMGEPGQPCVVCTMFKGAARPTPRHTHGKPREMRPGMWWHMDMIIFRDRSEEGCKYLIVLTDAATGYNQLIPLYYKGDATFELKRWILGIRGHAAFKGVDYQVVAKITTDNDGAWSDDNESFQEMVTKVRGLEIEYADPANHARDNATAEGANKFIETAIQSLLYENNLPPSWWQRAAMDVMFLAARFPKYGMDGNAPHDGDIPSPIERLYGDFYSRHQVYRDIDNYVSVGTPALCHIPEVKGSDNRPKVRWGIAIGRWGKVTRWLDPFINSQFRTRSFTAFKLRTGINWSQFLGLGDITPSEISRIHRPEDDGVKWDIELPAVRLNTVETPPPVRELLQVAEDDDGKINTKHFEAHPDDDDGYEFRPRLRRRELSGPDDKLAQNEQALPIESGHTDEDSDEDPGGQTPGITAKWMGGDDMEIDKSPQAQPAEVDSADFLYVEGADVTLTNRLKWERDEMRPSDQRNRRPAPRRSKRLATGDDTVESSDLEEQMEDFEIPAYGLSPEDDAELETIASREDRQLAITTDGKEHSWKSICKIMHSHSKELPHEQHEAFRLWLLTKERGDEPVIRAEDLSRSICEGRAKLRKGLYIPYPSGPHWEKIRSDPHYRKQLVSVYQLAADEEKEEELLTALQAMKREADGDPQPLAMLGRAMLSRQISQDEAQELIESMLSEDTSDTKAYAAKRKQRTSKDESDPAPKNVIEALLSDRADGWVESIYKEFDGLNDQGVFSHGWSKDKLRQAGITGKPVPCSVALTHKYKEANLHLENLTWDIKQAYTWAPLQPGERIAVVYPHGLKQYGPDGQELYAVLEKNLYGMPNAARGWGKHRDEFIERRFNQKGWRCKQSIADPCLWIIDRLKGKNWNSEYKQEHQKYYTGGETGLPDDASRTWLLIHTDDCDAYSQCATDLHEINDIMNDEWQTEIVDSSFVLGIKRTRTKDPSGWKCEMTMTAYIEEMQKTFAAAMEAEFGPRKKTFRTPFPENLNLSKAHVVPDDEIKECINKGYQRLVGSLLWAVRHVFPICSFGCSQLCKLMATPSNTAWTAALHMLGYMIEHKDRGICFSETTLAPTCFVDASNKDDPVDGKCPYGFTIIWGGPLITKAGKLNHVGINSTYNEYMALHHCNKHVFWLRQLLEEVGLAGAIPEPTIVRADNKQANTICSEDLVTAGNMYFRVTYHYNKEAVNDGYVKVVYVHTSKNVADACTKALAAVKISLFEPILHGYQQLVLEQLEV